MCKYYFMEVIVMKTVLKILAALAAIAGVIYVVATYGDKIVAWCKKVLGGCKCGKCEYRRVCGGSRARAYGSGADMMAAEPLCNYIPAALRNNAPQS